MLGDSGCKTMWSWNEIYFGRWVGVEYAGQPSNQVGNDFLGNMNLSSQIFCDMWRSPKVFIYRYHSSLYGCFLAELQTCPQAIIFFVPPITWLCIPCQKLSFPIVGLTHANRIFISKWVPCWWRLIHCKRVIKVLAHSCWWSVCEQSDRSFDPNFMSGHHQLDG